MVFCELNSSLNNLKMFPDYTNVIHSITTAGHTWVATENCVVIGSLMNAPSTGQGANVMVDGVNVLSVYGGTLGEFSIRGNIYVKKGQTVSTRYVGTYDLKAYGLTN